MTEHKTDILNTKTGHDGAQNRHTKQFARIHTSSLIKIETILNRPITKFYNSDDVNVIPAESRLIKTRPASLYKRHNLL